MPTFVAMSSRNRCVAISTNGLLSGIRDSNVISAFPLDPRPAHDERVDALVVPQEGPHVVLVDVHLGHVLRRNLRLPAPAARREQVARERVPGDGDVLRDLLPEAFVEHAEVAHRDVVDVLVVLIGHGLVRGAQPADREPRTEDRRDVTALAHCVQIADDVAVDIRDRHVREGRDLPFDAEGRPGLAHGDIERRPSEVRLLPHAACEVVPDPLPELDDAVRPGLLDHVLDQGSERDVDHERPPASPHTNELSTCFRRARHSFSAFAATASPSRSRSFSMTIVRNRSQCAGVMYGAVVPTSLYAMVTISWRGPGPTRGPSFDWRYCAISLFFLNSFVSPNFSTNRMRVSRLSSPATASSYEARTSGVIGRDSNKWRTTIDVLTTFARTPCIFVISTGFVVRKTRNARSPTPEMMIVPASNCWTDIIMFCPLSWLQMWARLPLSKFSNRYSRGSSWFGIEDEKIRPSTPENIAMSRSFSSRARFSSVSRRSFGWPTVSAPIVLSSWPA